MKVGLVLGAGGVVGAAWLIGALEAVAAETGWDPSSAEYVVGTSAGSVVGSLVADGIPPKYLSAYSAGRSLTDIADEDGRAARLAERVGDFAQLDDIAERLGGDRFKLHPALPPIGPGSWRLGLSTLVHPRRHPASALMAGWLPRGFVSTQPISELVETFIGAEWPDHPNYWAVAGDYRTGHRVAFGRDDAPRASIGQAVAASCAIPGFYHPVSIAGRRYVDGGICSLSNLDLLSGRGLDLVVCLNPTSSLAEALGGTPAERMGAIMRGVSGRRLGHEARKLRGEGTEVVLLQPTKEDVAGMGVNLMARGRRVAVLERSRATTAQTLRDLRDSGAALPGVRRRQRGASRPRRRAATAAPAFGVA